MQIILNGTPVLIEDVETMSYEELVELAGLKGYPTAVYSWRGPDGTTSGSLWPGKTVKPREGMIFSVVHTDA